MRSKRRTYDKIKAFLYKYLNRQVFIFLGFLLLSAIFWLFQTLNTEYEVEYKLPIQLRGVPDNVVITTELPEHISLMIKDKGIALMSYQYGPKKPSIAIDYSDVNNNTGHVRIPTSQLVKKITEKLSSSTKLVSVSPDTLEFFYNYGRNKRVPVKLSGQVEAAELYYISSIRFMPDSVTVYASPSILDTITTAYTDAVYYKGVDDTLQIWSRLKKIPGIKYDPTRVRITVNTDQLTEKTVEAPIRVINTPPDRQLRTFPARAKVTFRVGMSRYRYVTEEDFNVYVDYNDIESGNGNMCNVKIGTPPYGITHYSVSPTEVEYVIENI